MADVEPTKLDQFKSLIKGIVSDAIKEDREKNPPKAGGDGKVTGDAGKPADETDESTGLGGFLGSIFGG